MNLTDLLTTPAARALGWTLLHFLWQGALIASALGMLMVMFRKHSAQLRYALGLAALLVMALAPLATFIHQYNLAGTPAVNAVSPHAISPSVTFADELLLVEGTVGHREALGLDQASQPFLSRLEPWTPALAVFWFCGALLLSLRLFAGWVQLFWLRRFHAEPAGPFWQRKLEEIKDQLGLRCAIIFLQSTRVEVPAVLGWIRPVILFPASSFSGLTPSQLEAILLHELSHIRRHDCLVNLIQVLLETILFYHPAVWWVSKRIRQEREHCCDDCAIEISGDRIGYVRALTALEELRGYPSALALAAKDGSLLHRARRILGLPQQTRFSSAWVISSLLVFLAAIVCLLAVRGIVAAENSVPEPVVPNNPESITEIKEENLGVSTSAKPEPPRTIVSQFEVKLDPNTISKGGLTVGPPGDLAAGETGGGSGTDTGNTANPGATIHAATSGPPASPSAKLNFTIQFTEWKGAGLESWLENFKPDQPNNGEAQTSPAPSSSAEVLLILGGAGQTNRTSSVMAPLSTPWIMNPPSYKRLIQALEQRSGIDVLTAPRITTLSGRQAQVKMMQAKNIVIGVETNSTGVIYQPEPVEFGPSIDLIPHLSEDGSILDLIVSGRLFEFVGYDDSGPSGRVALDNGTTMKYAQPLPRFRSREFTAQASIPPGDTLVVYAGKAEEIAQFKSKVPILGDIPLLGRLFRREGITKTPSHIIILITSELLKE
jgi:beta-lactamase regulating signal transducer with metallopeptidase domain